MAAPRRAHVLARDVRREPARDQRQVLLQGHVDPAILAARIRGRELERLDGACQVVERLARDFPQ